MKSEYFGGNYQKSKYKFVMKKRAINLKFSKFHDLYEFGLSDGGRADIIGVLDKGISKNYRRHAESSHIFRNSFKCKLGFNIANRDLLLLLLFR